MSSFMELFKDGTWPICNNLQPLPRHFQINHTIFQKVEHFQSQDFLGSGKGPGSSLEHSSIDNIIKQDHTNNISKTNAPSRKNFSQGSITGVNEML